MHIVPLSVRTGPSHPRLCSVHHPKTLAGAAVTVSGGSIDPGSEEKFPAAGRNFRQRAEISGSAPAIAPHASSFVLSGPGFDVSAPGLHLPAERFELSGAG